MPKIKTFHIVSDLNTESGGLPRSVLQLCDALAKNCEIEVYIITSDKGNRKSKNLELENFIHL
jgi:hypothetical protein